MSDTAVFVPAWNEEHNLPAVLDELRAELPHVDVLVVDDGYRWALDHGYAFCGRVDADGQHPAPEPARLLALVRSDRCDVAVGSR